MNATADKSVKATCRKCGAIVTLNIGTQTREQVEATLQIRKSFECPGRHVELGSMADYYEVDWSTIADAVKVETPEEFGRKIIAQYGAENVFYLGGPELAALGIRDLRDVYKDLHHMGFGEFSNADFYFARNDAPGMGARFYVRSKRT